MITKAIIESVESPYSVTVRIPIFDAVNEFNQATSSEYLSTATICILPNMQFNPEVGDVVFVTFEDNDPSKPVIIGCLAKESGNLSSCNLEVESLDANSTVNIGKQVNIGDISYKELQYLQGLTMNVNEALKNIPEADLKGYLPLTGGTLSGNLDFSSPSSWITPYLLAFKNADGTQQTYPYTGFYQWGPEWQVNARDADNTFVHNLLTINNTTKIANFAATPTVNGTDLALITDIPKQVTVTPANGYGTTVTSGSTKISDGTYIIYGRGDTGNGTWYTISVGGTELVAYQNVNMGYGSSHLWLSGIVTVTDAKTITHNLSSCWYKKINLV